MAHRNGSLATVILPLCALAASACSSSTSGTGKTNGNSFGTGGFAGAQYGGGSAGVAAGGSALGGSSFAGGFGGGVGGIGGGLAGAGAGGGTSGIGGGISNGGSIGAGAEPGLGGTAGIGGFPTGGAAGSGAGAAGGGSFPDAGNSVPGTPCGGTLPAQADYTMNGPFAVTGLMDGSGPDGMYTVIQPSMLGQNGFKHPIATWGNGITTTPQLYPGLLAAIASEGIVVIASDSTSVTSDLMTTGLDWMIQQNDVAGPYQGKLNTTCLITIGYSLGGGAAVGAGAHANVAVTVSFHGVTGASNALHSPLLLMTSDTDTFVVPATFVTPTFNLSDVQTFYGTLSAAGDPSNLGHLIPVLDVGPYEQPAAIAWIRYWIYGDQGAKTYFWGDDCVLCKAPWDAPQRKNWN